MKTQDLATKVKELSSADNRLEQALSRIKELDIQVETLRRESTQLQADIEKLRMQKDILEQCALIIKKGRDVDPTRLSNREKTHVINVLRNRYPLKTLLFELALAKSSYCYQNSALARPDKYAVLRENIKHLFDENLGRYGYRRIWWLLKRQGICISEKVIRRLMKTDNLTVYVPRKRKYSSYQGEISPEVPNLLERDFHADRPNEKWLTDITEFAIQDGKVFLSPVIDCFDGMPVAWTIGTSPSAALANSMLQKAIAALKPWQRPTIHSDRGCHYRWPEWIEMTKSAGLTRSMSKKGCSPDNSACEGFFGRLKNEMFYGRDWRGVPLEKFMAQIDEYMHWYGNTRIKESLGGMSPMEYRLSKGLV